MLATSRLGFAATLIIVVVSLTAARPGQDPGRPAQQTDRQQLPPRISDQTYRFSVDLVNIFCSAWNKDTKSFVTNLSREDFTVFEDGQKQQVTNFAREANQPLTIALLVDTSQSVAPKLKFEQAAATNFFYTVLQPSDRALLVEFDSSVALVQDFTNNPNKLEKAIRSLQAAGNTALYDAVVKICDEKLIRENGRKTIVILSDGNDSASTATLEEALRLAQLANATIFSVSINRGGLFGVGGDTRAGDKVLEQLAAETGGKALFPFQAEDLDSAFREISQELRSQYNIGYVSNNALRDGKYRKIEVKIVERNLRLNFRKGYFAPNR